ncbi:hypothetical protein CANTEDRAFT_113613, partial [Yamadazyma tenuis ATCC 10573]
MVIYSKGEHFVDIRVFKDHYPVIEENPRSLKQFTDTFEWTMTGDEIPMEAAIPDTYVLSFTHEIDSLAVVKSIEENIPVEQCLSEPDVGTFWKLPDSEDRKETGNMTNPATGKKGDYVEIWRSLSALNATPSEDVRETPHDIANDKNLHVLRVLDNEQFEGQFIRSGAWCQGLLYDKLNKIVPLNVVRGYFDGEKWQWLIKYGSFNFPVLFSGSIGDTIDINGVVWSCI